MNQSEVVLTYEDIIEYFLQQNCSIEEAVNMIKLCPELLKMNQEQLDKKISLLFNSDIFYGIILCNKNDFKVYTCSQQEDNSMPKNCSYIMQNILETVEKPYIQKILQIEPQDTLEDKLYKMKKVPFNSDGYKVK